MFEIINKNQGEVTVKMDMQTFQGLSQEIDENLQDYEFVFDNPVLASELVK